MPEQKKKRKNVIIAAVVIAVLAVIAVLITILFLKKEKSYRSIRVIDVKGDVTVKRGGKEIDAYESMKLLSGDKITTGKGAELELLLDEDKHVILREESELKLEATGNAENSKTKLRLEVGEVYSEIENKLSKDSAYEVLTPGASMSVRGTIFTVTYRDHVLNVSVEEGKVRVKLDSTDESVDLEAGDSVQYLIEESENDDQGTEIGGNTGQNGGNGDKTDPDNGKTIDKELMKKWLNIYYNLAKQQSGDGLHLGFAFVNDDDIPEMYFSQGLGLEDRVIVFSTDGINQAETEWISSNGTAAYWERSGIVEDLYTGSNNLFGYRFIKLRWPYNVLVLNAAREGYTPGGDRFIVDEREVSKEEYENALEEFYQSVDFYERKHLPYQLGYEFNSANYKEVIDKALLQMVGIDVSVLENGTTPENGSTLDESGTAETSRWREAYVDFLKGYGIVNRSAKFSLDFIDDDDIPELLIADGSSHADGVKVYCYVNSTVVLAYEYGFGSNGVMNYVYKENVIESWYSGMGDEYRTYYRLEKGKAVKFLELHARFDMELGRLIEWYEGSEEISQAEYADKRMEALGGTININMSGYDDMYEMSENNFQRYISNYR